MPYVRMENPMQFTSEPMPRRRTLLLSLLLSAGLITGCGSEDADTPTSTQITAPAASETDNPKDSSQSGTRQPDEPKVNPYADSRYQFANACYTIRSGDGFLTAQQDGKYGVASSEVDATRFYMRPTELGSYLVMSGFERVESTNGNFELLGITDPGGEFLDASGKFIGELSYLVAGLGDTTGLILDPILPLGGILRGLGESIGFFGGQLGNVNVLPKLAMVNRPNDLSVWKVNKVEGQSFTLASEVTGLLLGTDDSELTLTLPSAKDEKNHFQFQPSDGCDSYPEAELNAEVIHEDGPAIYLKDVERFSKIEGLGDNDVFGFVDAHSHISAYEFIGGRINYGDPFHRFGVGHALEDCAINHGPQGTLGLLEMATSGTVSHETKGWPTFNDWPRNDSLQHHQSYYRWLERVHLSGMKILVNHLVHNEVLCQINPQKQNDCDPMESILLQIQRMYEMQDYIDAQHGGPGQGWFQIVMSPGEARDVIADGKMAVVLGIEMSKVLGCGEFLNVAECTRKDITERLDQLYQLGVRNIFPVHKFDNAFGGHLPDLSSGIGIGPVLHVGNMLETGHLPEFEECPEGTEFSGLELDQNAELKPFGLIDQLLFQLDYIGDRFPETPEQLQAMDPRRGTDKLCNARGLSDLGDFLIQELIRRKMMIETDHISRKAAARILELTQPLQYPVINSHGDWGGTEALRDRIAAQGGITASFGGTRGGWVDELIRNGQRSRSEAYKVGPFGGAGMASDVNGIAALAGNPGVPEDDAKLYPFESVDGRVRFDKQRTGDREFGLYDGRGVAHYGLFADQIADMVLNSDRDTESIDEAVNQLFTSAEAYLRMWERIENAPL